MLATTNFLPYEKPPVGDFSAEIIRYSGNFVKMHFAERMEINFCSLIRSESLFPPLGGKVARSAG